MILNFLFVPFIFLFMSSALASVAEKEASGSRASSTPIKWSVDSLGLSMEKQSPTQSGSPRMTEEEKGIRITAVNALLQIYQKMNENAHFPLPPERFPFIAKGESHWETDVSSAKMSPQGRSWLVLPKVGASIEEALQHLNHSGHKLDCTSASLIASLKICSTFSMPWNPSCQTEPNSLIKFSQGQETPSPPFSVENRFHFIAFGFFFGDKHLRLHASQPADRVYIEGHPDYPARYPLGLSRGENVYVVGYDSQKLKRYIGFGPLFKEGPQTLQYIQKYLAQAYIGDTSDEFRVAYLTVIKTVSPYFPFSVSSVQDLEEEKKSYAYAQSQRSNGGKVSKKKPISPTTHNMGT